MNDALKTFDLDQLIRWLEYRDCPSCLGTHEDVAAELREKVKVLQDYWDINHADRRCNVCHGKGDTIEFLGMMDDLMYPIMKTEECENCLGKGTVKV